MNHPELILRTLDRNLATSTRLILYGRAALALGFKHPQPQFHATMDVDAILPEVEMSAIEADDSFWDAIEKTNEQLESTGLYITHLFSDSQVILSPDWLKSIVPIPLPNLRFLRLFRPSTSDLILTKMMRIDPQDRSDIEFLIQQPDFDPDAFPARLKAARIPDIPDIHQSFDHYKKWLDSRI
ncbi:MAG: DUF6036 family nucleotidyltransferase [Luteolibacter sp.]